MKGRRYAEHHAQLYTKSQAHVVHSLRISAIFVKTKLTMAGWVKQKIVNQYCHNSE